MGVTIPVKVGLPSGDCQGQANLVVYTGADTNRLCSFQDAGTLSACMGLALKVEQVTSSCESSTAATRRLRGQRRLSATDMVNVTVTLPPDLMRSVCPWRGCAPVLIAVDVSGRMSARQSAVSMFTQSTQELAVSLPFSSLHMLAFSTADTHAQLSATGLSLRIVDDTSSGNAPGTVAIGVTIVGALSCVALVFGLYFFIMKQRKPTVRIGQSILPRPPRKTKSQRAVVISVVPGPSAVRNKAQIVPVAAPVPQMPPTKSRSSSASFTAAGGSTIASPLSASLKSTTSTSASTALQSKRTLTRSDNQILPESLVPI